MFGRGHRERPARRSPGGPYRGGVTDTESREAGRDSRTPGHYAAAFDDAGLLPDLRRWLRARLAERDETVVVDAELVCTELVTNAVEHGSAPRTLRIEVREAELSVEVDDAADGPLTPGRSRFGSFRGRGLVLVGSLARWGVRRREQGKTVWAALPLG